MKSGILLLQKLMQLTLITTIAIISATQLLVAENVYSQALDKRVDLSYRKADAYTVIKDIQQKTGVGFAFTDHLGLDKIMFTDVYFENQKLKNVLEALLTDKRIAFEEKSGTITLYRMQQPGRVSGRVIDAEGEPLAGASIRVLELDRSFGTDGEGHFSFSVQPGSYTLEATYISYGAQRQQVVVEAGRGAIVNFTLQAEEGALSEVVVVGYGTQRREEVTGSVSTLNGGKLNAAPAINPANGIAGRIPGLVVLTPSGEPGSNSTLRIRGENTLGDNAPLVVVDGIASREWERLNPQDIESITVLKDASAAIYGARAANGVILVTTKKGITGTPRIQFNYNEAISAPTMIPDAADAATYAQLINEVLEYEGAEQLYSAEDIEKYRNGSDPLNFPNTDWYDVALKKWSSQRTADVNISGGQEYLRYYVSAGTRFQDAIYNNSATSYQQHNLRVNLDGNFSKYVRYGANVAVREVHRDYPTESGSSIWSQLRRSKPNTWAYWPNGEPADNGDSGNPVVITTNQTGYDRNKTTVLESKGSMTIDLPWVKGLSITGNAALDITMQNDKLWKTPWYLYAWDGSTLDEAGNPVLDRVQRGYTNAELTQEFDETRLVTLNALVNYDFDIALDHRFKIMAGMESAEGQTMDFMAYRRHFVSTAIEQLFAGGDADQNNSGTAKNEARLNYFGRANYSFRDKYLLEFVWRYDGSYIFPEHSRFGFFPGFSAGWRLSEEPFWKPLLPYVNDFKIRGSWGRTGNDRINPYQFMSSYAYVTGATNIYIFNQNQAAKILQESRIANPNVTWEVANQTNVGMDMHFLNSKLTLSAEYFYNLRTDILWSRSLSVPQTSGLTLPDENIGEVVNRGAEFQLGYQGTAGALNYNISANISLNKNKIRFWDETPGVPDYQKSTGLPMNTALYYKAIGIFRDQAAIDSYPHWAGARPGDVIFEDVNGDGEINALDRIRLDKTGLPTQTGGLNADLSYKGFFASVFLQWATGAIRNSYYEQQGQIGNYLASEVEGRWTPTNIDASKPRAWNRYNEYWRNNTNTYWVQNTDYLRLKNVQIGYNFPARISKRLAAKEMQVYLSGLNLLTFTGADDLDPENAPTDTGSNNTSWTNAYPLNKVFNLGVSLTF